MNIEKYTGYFHDGGVEGIKHIKDKIEIAMESAELLPEWNEDNISLSKRSTISGKLYLEGIKSIKEDDICIIGIFKPPYDDGEISHLEIEHNKLKLLVSWINYSARPPEETDVFTIEIEAEKIIWENIPTLFDEYWDSL